VADPLLRLARATKGRFTSPSGRKDRHHGNG
jgi:hypothetical protein